jgi:hypothetical protein
VLELMHFEDELADPNPLALPASGSGGKEMDMALSLVEAMTEDWHRKSTTTNTPRR